MSKYDIPKDLAEKLKMFMKGMKRHVAQSLSRMATAK
jgi:hypothetical protein